MKFAIILALGLLLPVVTMTSSLAQTDPIVEQILQANSLLQNATKTYDVDTIKDLITDDFVLISSSAHVYDRSAFLADIGDKSAIWELNDTSEAVVRHYNDDCAVITAVLHIKYHLAAPTNKEVDVRVRFTDTWVKINGKWRYASGHASTIKS